MPAPPTAAQFQDFCEPESVKRIKQSGCTGFDAVRLGGKSGVGEISHSPWTPAGDKLLPRSRSCRNGFVCQSGLTPAR